MRTWKWTGMFTVALCSKTPLDRNPHGATLVSREPKPGERFQGARYALREEAYDSAMGLSSNHAYIIPSGGPLS